MKELAERGVGGMGMGGHSLPNKGTTSDWLTPLDLLVQLGTFDLDPCAAPLPRPWNTARHHITLPDDGLAAEWEGRVWLNPPYGQETAGWMERLAAHGTGTALIFARTETECWRRFVWPSATAILFLEGRLFFHWPSGTRAPHNAGAPSALVAYGLADANILRLSQIAGGLVKVDRRRRITARARRPR